MTGKQQVYDRRVSESRFDLILPEEVFELEVASLAEIAADPRSNRCLGSPANCSGGSPSWRSCWQPFGEMTSPS